MQHLVRLPAATCHLQARLPQPLLWEASHSQGPLNLLCFPWALQSSLGDPEDGLWMHTLGSKSCLHHRQTSYLCFLICVEGQLYACHHTAHGAYQDETLESSEQSRQPQRIKECRSHLESL